MSEMEGTEVATTDRGRRDEERGELREERGEGDREEVGPQLEVAMKRRECLAEFFFQAEDGMRDIGVTGVQTCALPISCLRRPRQRRGPLRRVQVPRG